MITPLGLTRVFTYQVTLVSWQEIELVTPRHRIPYPPASRSTYHLFLSWQRSRSGDDEWFIRPKFCPNYMSSFGVNLRSCPKRPFVEGWISLLDTVHPQKARATNNPLVKATREGLSALDFWGGLGENTHSRFRYRAGKPRDSGDGALK